MKKILLLLLLSVSYFSSAQSTYSIAKALQLQTVNESTSKSDSVLVRGADKIVKFVPRSEFGGGSQDLQQTIINGNTAYGVEGSGGASINLMEPDESGTYTNSFFMYRGLTDSNIYQDPGKVYIESLNSIGKSKISASANDGILISREIPSVGKTDIKFTDPIANTTLNFPAKPEGIYTIATLNDITGGSQTLQQTLTNGNTAIIDSSKVELLATQKGNRIVNFEMNSGDYQGTMGVGPGYTNMGASTSISTAGIGFSFSPDDNDMKLQFIKATGDSSTQIDFAPFTEIGNSELKIPFKVGAHTFALDSDVNIQSIIDNDIKTGSIDGGNSQIDIFSGNTNNRTFSARTSSGGSAGTIRVSNNVTSLIGNNDGVADAGIIIIDGSMSISQTAPGRGTTYVGFTTPINNNYISFPANPYGTYTLSVAVTYNDPTTTALSSSNLTDAYPAALRGDKVQALSITGGSIIYEKTDTGWIQYSATIIP